MKSGALPDKAPGGLDCPFSHCELRQALASPVDCASPHPLLLNKVKHASRFQGGEKKKVDRKAKEEREGCAMPKLMLSESLSPCKIKIRMGDWLTANLQGLPTTSPGQKHH